MDIPPGWSLAEARREDWAVERFQWHYGELVKLKKG